MLKHINLLNVEGFRLSTDEEWWNKRGVFKPSDIDDYVQVLLQMDQSGIDHPEMAMLKRIEV
jgi:hypothetical protein